MPVVEPSHEQTSLLLNRNINKKKNCHAVSFWFYSNYDSPYTYSSFQNVLCIMNSQAYCIQKERHSTCYEYTISYCIIQYKLIFNLIDV